MIKTLSTTVCRGRTGEISLVHNRGKAGFGRTVKRAAGGSGKDQGLNRRAMSGKAVRLDAMRGKQRRRDRRANLARLGGQLRRRSNRQQLVSKEVKRIQVEVPRGVQSAHACPDKAILSDPSCLYQQRDLAMARRQDLIDSPLPRWYQICKGSWR